MSHCIQPALLHPATTTTIRPAARRTNCCGQPAPIAEGEGAGAEGEGREGDSVGRYKARTNSHKAAGDEAMR